MVSTRQMSTSLSSTNGGPSEDGPTISTRLSVATRQASNSVGLVTSTPKLASSRSNLLSASEEDEQEQRIFLLDLPVELLEQIFSYVGYKKVGQMRVISKQTNEVCCNILNSTFSKLTTQMLNRFQTVKAKMPRRESARRNHPLACECDIIETCYMRLSLLQMTFGKHIERRHCCFFPGGILDEVYHILNHIRTTPRLERPFQVTDELFDLSTMAMEYFKDKIEPNLPEIGYFNKDIFFDIPTTKSKQSYSSKAIELSDDSSSTPPQSNMVLRKGIRKIKQGMKMYNNQLSVLRSELRTCKRKSSEQGKQIAEQQKLLAEQQKQTVEYANRLDENDKKNEEMSRKFSTLLQELNKCKTELQYWRSKSPATQTCTSCGHKIAPFVPPEVYQALVNQGIKPEDINMVVDDTDDSDTSSISNNTLSDSGISTEFVFPDETTTAKLLAVNSATKNLKRHHQDDDCSATVAAALEGVASSSGCCVATSIGATTDLNLGLRNGSNSTNAGHSGVSSNNGNGCPTNVFYGTSDKPTKGGHASTSFATSPSALVTAKNASIGVGGAAGLVSTVTSSGAIDVAGLTAVAAAAINGCIGDLGLASADVTSLNCIVSNESKKARRVQKGSRCHNVSSKRK